MPTEPLLYGSAESVYTRIARLALIEKAVPYRFERIDVFAPAGVPAGYRTLHPFGRIPALVHDGFELFETAAVTRYVDEAFAGPALQPADPRGRARMTQILGLLDSYAYRAMVWDIYVERMRKPLGQQPDEAKIAAATKLTATCLATLAGFLGSGSWLIGTGEGPSLADLHAAPMIAYLLAAPEGANLLAPHRALQGWWHRIAGRPSMRFTPSPLLDSLVRPG